MQTTDAIALNIRNLGESDELASLYTRDFGKVVARVRASKTITTKQGNFLHIPGVVQCSLVLGRTGYLLSGVSSKKVYPNIYSNFLALGYITSFLNIVDSLVFENQKDDKIWGLLNGIFNDVDNALQSKDISIELWKHEKEWTLQLVNILGLKAESVSLNKINSKLQFDNYLKTIFEINFDQKIKFFQANA